MHGQRLLIAAVIVPGLAQAGAWTQPAGEGQAITSASAGVAPVLATANPAGDREDSFTSVYLEYGLIEGLTLGATMFAEVATRARTDHTASAGLFLRKRVWQGERGGVASVQAGGVHPIDGLFGPQFGGPGAEPTKEVSLRLLYGRGFGGPWGTAFLSTEAGFHRQLNAEPDAWRLDLTAGFAPDPCCLMMLSAYTSVTPSDIGSSSLKLAPSVAYTFGAGEDSDSADDAPEQPVTLQFGLLQDVLDLGAGFGVQVSIWRPF